MLETFFDTLRTSQIELARQTGAQRSAALLAAAAEIENASNEILAANMLDVDAAKKAGTKESLVERLELTAKKIALAAAGVRTVAGLADPLGRALKGWRQPSGMFIEQVSVPLGVVAIIYESRPDVTADAWSLAYKAGCGVLLRGSGAAQKTNAAIVDAIKKALAGSGGIPGSVELAPGVSHAEVDTILAARGKIDVVLPRGGHALIRHVVENSRVPVIETGEGNCHIFVDESAEIKAACDIVYNAKVQRPGACNAVETLLLHENIAAKFMTALVETFAHDIEFRCDSRCIDTANIAKNKYGKNIIINAATEDDWKTEYLDYILAVKTIANIDDAITHISTYSTHHSDAILTNDMQCAERFLNEVDSACVYVNASTRFTDGAEFGFGAELGISTQKFHARGPMGLDALTTYKYKIRGENNIRM